MRIKNRTTLEEIKNVAVDSSRLVYGFNTCWWKIGDPVYSRVGMPCGPRGEMLLETDDPITFLAIAMANPGHYGKHGLDAFVAAYHGNLVTEDGHPTSLESWDEYNRLIDDQARET
jgi:hypothetical protein